MGHCGSGRTLTFSYSEKLMIKHNAGLNNVDKPWSNEEEDERQPGKDQVDEHDWTTHDEPGGEVNIIIWIIQSKHTQTIYNFTTNSVTHHHQHYRRHH